MNPTETVHRTKQRLLAKYTANDIANNARIGIEGSNARFFLDALYHAWITRIDEAWAWEMIGDEGFGLNFDDRIDLRTELANDAVAALEEMLPADYDVRRIYGQITYYELDEMVDELVENEPGIGMKERMAMALVIVCEKFLDQLHSEALYVATEMRTLDFVYPEGSGV